MSTPNPTAPPSLTHPEKITSIRKILEQANYTEQYILSLLGISECLPFRQRRRSLPIYLRRTGEDAPLSTLVRLFLLRESVSLQTAKQTLAPMSPEEWAEMGLLRLDRDQVWATVELFPFGDLIIAADWPTQVGVNPHQVMSIAATTRTLAQMTLRRQVNHSLDLGTGSGALAFLLQSHSQQVFGVDCNPRAIALARFNARLNDMPKITWKIGDLFEPVQDQTFDLIVCNPPFVIAPRVDDVSTHSGYSSDELCQTIVQSAPAFLKEGGYCQILCNWAQIKGQDWRERLAGWCRGTGCDAWVLYSHLEQIADYALQRIGEMAENLEQTGVRFDEWITYYEEQGIEAIGFGLITLRRKSHSPNWFRCDHIAATPSQAGAEIEKGFALRDFLEAHQDDEKLLTISLRPADDVRLHQQLEMSPKGWLPKESRLHRTESFGFSVNLDPPVLEFVARCQDGRSLGDHLKDIAGKAGQKPQRLASGFLKVVRRLVEMGILVPAEEMLS